MAKLSKAAVQMLEDAGCNEVADDYIVIGDAQHVTVLLSAKAVEDLNRQARATDRFAGDTAILGSGGRARLVKGLRDVQAEDELVSELLRDPMLLRQYVEKCCAMERRIALSATASNRAEILEEAARVCDALIVDWRERCAEGSETMAYEVDVLVDAANAIRLLSHATESTVTRNAADRGAKA
jgi:hypothetical protein